MLPPTVRVTFVVPAYQAAHSVARVVTELLEVAAQLPQATTPSVLVVDDGSSDETAERAASAGALVVRHLRNRGKGVALLSGFRRARAPHEPGLQPLRKRLLEDAREFYEKFAEERDQEPEARGELGKSLFRLAQITGDIDSADAAIALHQRARDLFAKLVADQPGNPEYKSDLAMCDHNLGRLYRITDRMGDAETSCQKAVTGWEELLREVPKEARYRAGLARSQNVMGNVYQLTLQFDKAIAADTKALALWIELSAEDRVNAEYQRYLALSHNHLGMVYNDTGEVKKAEQTLGESLTIRKKLSHEHLMSASIGTTWPGRSTTSAISFPSRARRNGPRHRSRKRRGSGKNSPTSTRP